MRNDARFDTDQTSIASSWNSRSATSPDTAGKQFDEAAVHARTGARLHASYWPALRDVPWFPAIGDGAAACVGSGCVSLENWSDTIGASSAMRVVVPPEQIRPLMGLWLYLLDGRRAVLGGAQSEGGNLLTWLDNVLSHQGLGAINTLRVRVKDSHAGCCVYVSIPVLSDRQSYYTFSHSHDFESAISF
jgi:sugar (pentulose or hexulose) kinase